MTATALAPSVKRSLSAKRRIARGRRERPTSRQRAEREAPELEAMIGRILRSLVRRSTDGDLDSLVALANLVSRSRAALVEAGRGAHDGPARYSYREIGLELGMTRQAAAERFGSCDESADNLR